MANWILIAEWLARIILFGLICLSIWSISIMIERRRFLKMTEKKDSFLDLDQLIRQNDKNRIKVEVEKNSGLRSGAMSAVANYSSALSMEKSFSAYMANQKNSLEKGISVLGTLGSTSPFIGLLGTILGIIVAFGALSTGQMDSQKVMYALAESLVLTATGLMVAIPAVIAFNYFNRRTAKLLRECGALKDLMIAQFAKD